MGLLVDHIQIFWKIKGGGVKLPPPLFSYCDTNLKHLIRFWKALGLHFNNQQKNGKFAKILMFSAKPSY